MTPYERERVLDRLESLLERESPDALVIVVFSNLGRPDASTTVAGVSAFDDARTKELLAIAGKILLTKEDPPAFTASL